MLDCDLVIMPVHLAMHWTCAVVNLRDHELLYLDSMGVRRWLHHIVSDVHGDSQMRRVLVHG